MTRPAPLLRAASAAALLALAAPAQAAEVDPVGIGAPVSTVQESLALTPLIRTSSVYNDLGTVKFFAGGYAPAGYALADGSTLPIDRNAALFSVLGTTYGGDGRTNFRLPDLRGRAAVGTGGRVAQGEIVGVDDVRLTIDEMPSHRHRTADGLDTTAAGGGRAFENRQPGLGLDFEVTTAGDFFPSPGPGGTGPGGEMTTGFVSMDAASRTIEDSGRTPAEGGVLPIASNIHLFATYGTNHGGDGRTTVGLPDLRDRIAIGAEDIGTVGARAGTETTSLSEGDLPRHVHGDEPGPTLPAGGGGAVSNAQPSLSFAYLIATSGIFPSRTSGSADSEENFLGEIAMFGGNYVPQGFEQADGRLLSIGSNVELFSILGTSFGGDGRTTFRLPDLRGRVAVGAGDGGALGDLRLGETIGSDLLNLTTANLPSHTHAVDRPAPVPLPAGLLLLVGALAAMAGLRRRA